MVEEKKRRGRPPGSKNKSRSTAVPPKSEAGSRLKDEIWAIAILAFGIFLVVSIQTEAAGQFGLVISKLLKGSFGMIAYVLPYYLLLYGLLLFAKRTAHISGRSVVFLFLIFLMLTLINSARYLGADSGYSFSLPFIGQMFQLGTELKTGGAFGMTVGYLLVKVIGMTGLYILSFVVILISVMLVINTPVSQFFDHMKAKRQAKKSAEQTNVTGTVVAQTAAEPIVKEGNKTIADTGKLIPDYEKSHPFENKEYKHSTIELPVVEPYPVKPGPMTENQLKILDYMNNDDLFEKAGPDSTRNGMGLEELSAGEQGMGLDGDRKILDGNSEKTADRPLGKAAGSKPGKEEAAVKTEELHIKTGGNAQKPFQLPPIDLLAKGPNTNVIGENESLKVKASKLEQTLRDFNVNAKVVQVTKGPAVTRYEIQPNTGVKVSSIVRLADDIALNLEAKSIRIEAPIPGKAAVGIEVENERVNLVALREIIESSEYKTAKSKI
ncbi:MAG TPA: DNA translocase FtsK 4TM domain-containing protein, partial [Anaerovoracaceae bacterium]|nr:DNA translocase FtsK 4TM domain-containing protein [Anaerovoracaceae bacterium]